VGILINADLPFANDFFSYFFFSVKFDDIGHVPFITNLGKPAKQTLTTGFLSVYYSLLYI
jgi:hypothetical protein